MRRRVEATHGHGRVNGAVRLSTWLRSLDRRADIHHDRWRKKRENHAKRAELSRGKKSLLDKREAEDYRVKAMEERRQGRIVELSRNCRDFRRYLRTLRKLAEDESVHSIYSGVVNVDLGALIEELPGVSTLEDRDRFLLVEETYRFVELINRLTFGSRKKRGYVRGDFGFDLPKGETYTLTDVKNALGLH